MADMKNALHIALPVLLAIALAAFCAVALLSDDSPQEQAQAVDTEASHLRYALTSANASVAIATDRAEALEREVALLDVPVRDRGPYTPGREFDLSAAVARSLGFSGVHAIEWRILP